MVFALAIQADQQTVTELNLKLFFHLLLHMLAELDLLIWQLV